MNPYQYDADYLAQRREELQGAIGAGALLPVLCTNTAKRIRASSIAYLEYGPYWWAVKKILNDNGYEFGSSRNDYMADRFGMKSAELTLIAGWECADQARANTFAGTRDFNLGDEEDFSLFDPDMERSYGR